MPPSTSLDLYFGLFSLGLTKARKKQRTSVRLGEISFRWPISDPVGAQATDPLCGEPGLANRTALPQN
jgi:hypothetical protein